MLDGALLVAPKGHGHKQSDVNVLSLVRGRSALYGPV